MPQDYFPVWFWHIFNSVNRHIIGLNSWTRYWTHSSKTLASYLTSRLEAFIQILIIVGFFWIYTLLTFLLYLKMKNEIWNLKLKNEITKQLADSYNLLFMVLVFSSFCTQNCESIVLVFKKDSKLDYSNYHPISLLSNIEKILEKLIKRLYTFLNKKNNVIYNSVWIQTTVF